MGILLQWFWSGVTLTGNETDRMNFTNPLAFWSGVTLTGNETLLRDRCVTMAFWSGVTLTGNETGAPVIFEGR